MIDFGKVNKMEVIVYHHHLTIDWKTLKTCGSSFDNKVLSYLEKRLIWMYYNIYNFFSVRTKMKADKIVFPSNYSQFNFFFNNKKYLQKYEPNLWQEFLESESYKMYGVDRHE